MAIDRNEALNEYKNKASSASEKLVRKYTAVPNKVASASSEEAQRNFEEAMRDPKVLKRRQSNLKKLNEEDLNRAMREKGGSAYALGVQSGSGKWAKNVEPYLATIDSILPSLPKKSRNLDENVNKRLLPLIKAMRAKKDSSA